jgi:phosphatidylinositol 3-kinase
VSDPKHGLFPLPAPLPLPLNANISISSLVPEKSSVFKSNLVPLLLWFETTDLAENRPSEDDSADGQDGVAVINPDYPIIFKNGDDLRQDQLVIQLFTLMDRLLRKENLDLRLSPYSVLATSTVEGMIQFVPSKSLAAIMAEFGSLQNYLRRDHADDGALGSFGIDAGVMDTFVRSCGMLHPLASLRHLTRSWIFRVDVCARSGRPTFGQPYARARWSLFPRQVC